MFYRSKDRCYDKWADFKHKGNHYYFRPGYKNFVKELVSHPRVELGFYSSIMRRNIIPAVFACFPSSEINVMQWIFDQEFCSRMLDHKYYASLAENEWDTFRDLNKVLKDPKIVKAGFTRDSILLIDSDQKKVQFDLDNSLVNIPYAREDVEGNESLVDGKVRNKKVQEEELSSLLSYVKGLLDSDSTVPDYLKANPSARFSPKFLLEEK